MNLEILLYLQELRLSSGSLITSFMLMVTDLAMAACALLCMVIFWAVDRGMGYWLIFNCCSSLWLNSIIKLTACVYRPWVRFSQVKPQPEALDGATGYSFPSSHTQITSSAFGAFALSERKKNRGLTVFCIIIILLTGFSRVYLGVHTPLDVLAAMASSALLLGVNALIFKKIRENPGVIGKVLAAGCVIVLLSIVYFTFKSYPMDYADGALIVDPAVMRNDGYAAAGLALGALAGTAIETRYIRFSTDGTLGRKILRLIGGVPFAVLIMAVFKKTVYALIGSAAGHVVVYCVLALYIVAGYPALFMAVQRRIAQKKD